MSFITCPKCLEDNISTAMFCSKCGEVLSKGSTESNRYQRPNGSPSTNVGTKATTEKIRVTARSYPALLGLASFCHGASVFIGIVFLLAVVVSIGVMIAADISFWIGLGVVILLGIYGGFLIFLFQLFAEGILVLLDIAKDTDIHKQVSENILKQIIEFRKNS